MKTKSSKATKTLSLREFAKRLRAESYRKNLVDAQGFLLDPTKHGKGKVSLSEDYREVSDQCHHPLKNKSV